MNRLIDNNHKKCFFDLQESTFLYHKRGTREKWFINKSKNPLNSSRNQQMVAAKKENHFLVCNPTNPLLTNNVPHQFYYYLYDVQQKHTHLLLFLLHFLQNCQESHFKKAKIVIRLFQFVVLFTVFH